MNSDYYKKNTNMQMAKIGPNATDMSEEYPIVKPFKLK
jgi:hypothetical protein